MEAYKLSSKLTEKTGEYIIETTNDLARARVETLVFVDGILTDHVCKSYQPDMDEEKLLRLVKKSHNSKKEELERLLSLYRQVAQLSEPGPMLQLGIAFHYRGFLNEAQGLLNGVTRLDKENHQALNYLGRTYLMQGQVKKAIEVCSAAVEMKPTFPDYQFHMGEALLADSQCEEAIKAYGQATSVNLYYAEAHFSLGLAYILDLLVNPTVGDSTDKSDKAVVSLEKSALIDEEFRTATFKEGLNLLKQGRFREAFDSLHQLSLDKRRDARHRSAAVNMKPTMFPELLSIEILTERIDYLETQLDQNPSYLDLHKEMAFCQLHLARLWWQDGAERFRKVYEMNPGSANARLVMEEAESVYEDLAITLRLISEKK